MVNWEASQGIDLANVHSSTKIGLKLITLWDWWLDSGIFVQGVAWKLFITLSPSSGAPPPSPTPHFVFASVPVSVSTSTQIRWDPPFHTVKSRKWEIFRAFLYWYNRRYRPATNCLASGHSWTPAECVKTVPDLINVLVEAHVLDGENRGEHAV